MLLTQLCESMIKLPYNMPDDFMEFIYAYIIDFMEVKTEDSGAGLEVLVDRLDIRPSKPDLHKRLKFSHASNIIMQAKVRLSAYDFAYPIDESDKVMTVRLVDMGKAIHGGYDDDKNLLTINVHDLKMLLASSDVNHNFVAYIVKEIENTMEHELMHYVQHKSFGKISPKQLDTYEPKNGSVGEFIKYASSPVEFLPMLKSEFNTFKTLVEFLQKDVSLNQNDKTQLLRYYVGDKSARIGRLHEFADDFKSHLLWSLRDRDHSTWKKAVKIMFEQFTTDPILAQTQDASRRT